MLIAVGNDPKRDKANEAWECSACHSYEYVTVVDAELIEDLKCSICERPVNDVGEDFCNQCKLDYPGVLA